MFRKAFTVKTSNAVKGSEWKAQRKRLIEQFPLLEPYLAEIGRVVGDKIQFATEKSTGMLYSKPNCHDSNALVAIVTPGDNHLLPSLMTCWHVPGCVPVFRTHSGVLERIFEAADLMAPGILGEIPPEVKVGDIVGIVDYQNPDLVLALGVSLMSSEQISTDRKGRAVHTIHYLGDTLWEKCGKPKPMLDPIIPPPSAHADATDDLVLDTLPQPEQQSMNAELAQKTAALSLKDFPIDSSEPVADEAPADAPPGPPMEEVATQALACAIPHIAQDDFPILGSTLHSKYLLAQNKALDFKSTKWKKLAKFLKSMDKDEKMISTKEIRGEVHVTSVNLQHPLVTEMARNQAKSKSKSKSSNGAATSARPTSAGSGANVSAQSSGGVTKVFITPYFQPVSALDFIWTNKSEHRSLHLTKAEVNQALEAYYTANELVSPSNRRMIRLDPYLCKYSPGPNADSAKKDDLFAAIVTTMRKFHTVSTAPNELRKGEFQRILVSIEKRQGRKLMTVIKHLAQLFDLAPLQQEFSVKCASSVSIPTPGVITIQGNQIKLLKQWVVDRGIAHLVDFNQK